MEKFLLKHKEIFLSIPENIPSAMRPLFTRHSYVEYFVVNIKSAVNNISTLFLSILYLFSPRRLNRFFSCRSERRGVLPVRMQIP